MKSILLIEELSPSIANMIEESSTDGKNVFLSGVFMQGGIKNRNNRNYPVNEIAKAVQDAQKVIQETGGIFGELDHPQTLNINLDRISHVITELKMQGDNAIGRAKLIETPMGRIAKELLKSGVRIGVSSRGAGTVTEEGMVNGFNFITVDIVATPSAPGAMPSTVYESLRNSSSGQQALSLSEELRNDPAAQKYFANAMKKFIEEITKKE